MDEEQEFAGSGDDQYPDAPGEENNLLEQNPELDQENQEYVAGIDPGDEAYVTDADQENQGYTTDFDPEGQFYPDETDTSNAELYGSEYEADFTSTDTGQDEGPESSAYQGDYSPNLVGDDYDYENFSGNFDNQDVYDSYNSLYAGQNEHFASNQADEQEDDPNVAGFVRNWGATSDTVGFRDVNYAGEMYSSNAYSGGETSNWEQSLGQYEPGTAADADSFAGDNDESQPSLNLDNNWDWEQTDLSGEQTTAYSFDNSSDGDEKDAQPDAAETFSQTDGPVNFEDDAQVWEPSPQEDADENSPDAVNRVANGVLLGEGTLHDSSDQVADSDSRSFADLAAMSWGDGPPLNFGADSDVFGLSSGYSFLEYPEQAQPLTFSALTEAELSAGGVLVSEGVLAGSADADNGEDDKAGGFPSLTLQNDGSGAPVVLQANATVDIGADTSTNPASEKDVNAAQVDTEAAEAGLVGLGLFQELTYPIWKQLPNPQGKLTDFNLSFQDISGFSKPTGYAYINRVNSLTGNPTKWKGLRLDYGPNVKIPKVDPATGEQIIDPVTNKAIPEVNWHWNQDGVNKAFGIENHTKLDSGTFGEAFGQSLKITRPLGKVALVAGVAADTWSLGSEVNQSLQTGQWNNTVVESARIAGGWGGGWAGAEAGGGVGATIGTVLLPGLGTVVGGAVGGLVGGALGYFAGSEVAETAAEQATGYQRPKQ